MKIGVALDLGSSADVRQQVDAARPLLEAAEAGGFDSVWLGESYPAQPTAFHLPAPLITLAYLAGVTGLGLGTGVLVLRAYNARQLAHEVAVLDRLSHGRLTLGIGLGDPKISERLASGRLEPNHFDTALATLKASWSEQEEPLGDWFTRPAPQQRAGPPILIGGSGNRALDRAVTVGDGYFAATHYSDALLEARAREYWERRGDDGGAVCVTRLCVIRETRAAAEQAATYLTPISDFYTQNNVWGLGPDDTADPAAGALLVGTPQEVGARLAEYRSWGVTRVNLRLAALAMPIAEAIETVRLLSAALTSSDGPPGER